MKLVLYTYSFFVLCFIFPLRNTHAGSPVVLLSLPLKDLDTSLTEDVFQELEQVLRKNNFSTEPRQQTTLLESSPQTKNSLASALKSAEDYEFNFKNTQAVQTLEQALDRFEQNTPSFTDLQILSDAHLFLAYCYKNAGKTSLMSKELDEAARLNPSLIPSEMLYPPSLDALFESAKDRLWRQKEFSSIMVESSPDQAQIFINGVFKGVTPLRLDRHPLGKHHFSAKLGNKYTYKEIILKKGTAPSLKLKLSSNETAKSQSKPEKTVLSGTNLKKQGEWLKEFVTQNGYQEAVGIGVFKKSKKIKVALHKISPKDFKSQLVQFSSEDSAKTIANRIALIITR